MALALISGQDTEFRPFRVCRLDLHVHLTLFQVRDNEEDVVLKVD